MNSDGGVERIDLEKVDWRGSREFFESLGDALDKLDDHDESYDFTWVGKRKSIIEAGAPINKTFRPDVENSKNWDTTENLFIEGDNLDALKLLQESYLGKVKMIYIDPPYNTGKDFVYHDNFRADTEQYDEDTEYKDDEGNIQFKKNEKSNGRYHSDWLSMMYPRLKLARNLLSEDGVIFISIGDDELANLRKISDEIFGEDNFLGTISRRQSSGSKNDNGRDSITDTADYILSYRRGNFCFLPVKVTNKKSFLYSDSKGAFSTRALEMQGGGDTLPQRPKMGYSVYYNQQKNDIVLLFDYDLTNTPVYKDPDAELLGSGYKCYRPRPRGDMALGIWRWGDVTFKERFAEGNVYFDKGRVYMKERATDTIDKYPEAILDGHLNTQGTNVVKSLFSERVFSFPKPVSLVEYLLNISTTKDDLILDFFSGSATTAHAVMQLNAEDGGSRKWIMVQLPEETDEKSEAFKAGYKTIPEISRERIRRAGDKIASEHPDAKVDYGFRALRIDDTNHKDVYRPAADYQQNMLDELVDNVKEDRSDLDLLYGVLTATAWELNKPLETVELAGSTVYKYDYFGEVSGLVACFADEISEEAIKQIAQLKPLTAVFKEGSFPNSQAKVNLAEHFRIISSDTKVKVI